MKARVTVALKPGVLDAEGRAIADALHSMGFAGVRGVRVGRVVELELDEGTDLVAVDDMARRLLANPVIEHWRVESAAPTGPTGG